jgi:hypothetical protein
MQSLVEQPPTEATVLGALAEPDSALAELEATDQALLRSNATLAEIMQAHELEARRCPSFRAHPAGLPGDG